ncbi:MAG: hypothetical protein JW982_01780 [Spirochaetes bacterium]|nr:hypothetical protein [Spirochaetota bacterium]
METDIELKNGTTWEDFLKEGNRYLEIVKGGSNSAKFTPEILYNLACMSIEKLFMAYFLKNRTMPGNHTLIDLVEAMNEIGKVPEQLEKELLYMNGFQEICSIEQYSRKIPEQTDITRFIGTLDLTRSYIQELIG